MTWQVWHACEACEHASRNNEDTYLLGLTAGRSPWRATARRHPLEHPPKLVYGGLQVQLALYDSVREVELFVGDLERTEVLHHAPTVQHLVQHWV
jgi:hypothetical protein